MALTKVKGSGVEGITNLSNATFLSVDASEVATLLTTAVINSEGGAVTTNIAQGLAKCWIIFTGTGTIATRDSLNVGSTTDVATGNYRHTLSNNMANTNYCALASGDMYGVDSFPAFNLGTTNRGYTTSAITGNSCKVNGASTDAPSYQLSSNGDLA